MKIKVGVLFGGVTVEHEVSIITAIQAMNKMDNNKYEIIPIYIDKNRKWYTGAMLRDIEIYKDMDLLRRYAKEVVLYNLDGRFVLQSKTFFKKIVQEIDMCFPIMHGTNGEDGTLQGYLETIGIPYAECDSYASCVGQDKIFMKQIFEACDVPVVKYDWLFDYEYETDPDKAINKLKHLKFPLIIKPARLGSSVGISTAHNVNELKDSIEEAIKYDIKVLIEEKVSNLKEVNISVLGNYKKQQLSVIEEVGSINEILTYEDKYVGGSKGPSKGMASAKRLIPARISEELAHDVQKIAIKAFKALNSSGVVRIDFLIDEKNNKVYANETNNIPGSLSFYLWDKTDKEYPELLDEVLTLGIRDYKDKYLKVHSFGTNILKSFNGLKGSKGIKK